MAEAEEHYSVPEDGGDWTVPDIKVAPPLGRVTRFEDGELDVVWSPELEADVIRSMADAMGRQMYATNDHLFRVHDRKAPPGCVVMYDPKVMQQFVLRDRRRYSMRLIES